MGVQTHTRQLSATFRVNFSWSVAHSLYSSSSSEREALGINGAGSYTGWSRKVRPLRLKAHIFKMSEPVCVVFGTSQHCFVLNTSVTSISNKFIIQVAPPGDKINHRDFYLQNLARPCASILNVYIFEIPEPNCTIFGTIQCHDIVNMPVTSFSSTA